MHLLKGSLIVVSLCVIFLVFLMLRALWTSWICGYIVYIKFGRTLANVSSQFLLYLPLVTPVTLFTFISQGNDVYTLLAASSL